MHPKILSLVGFMGCGKSTVGRLLADRLGRPFLDTDALIEADAGCTVAEIFARDGEAAFRERERRALEEAIARAARHREGAILSTGGGTPVDPENARRMRLAGPVVHLASDARTLWQRVEDDAGRPLVQEGYASFRARHTARSAIYRAFPYRIPCDAPPEELARRLAAMYFAQSRELGVAVASRSYPIQIAAGGLSGVGEAMARRLPPGPCLVVSQAAVAGRYGAIAEESLRAAGWRPTVVRVPAGEGAKSLGHAKRLYQEALTAGLERRSPIVALGGGVVGDLAGFVAATYQRGLPFVQVPTTLLAQIDSAVGGKVAVNLPAGKNLVGAFHQPALVLVDPLTLSTLPRRELAAGLAEMVKYGVILDEALFARMEREADALLAGDLAVRVDLIARCCELKAQVVASDERESGIRAILNFGHTVGHAIEALTGYRTYLHGEAVAMGMVAAGALAVSLGRWRTADQERLVALLERLDLPTGLPTLPVSGLLAAMAHDKKVEAGRLRFVLPEGLGRARLHDSIPQALLCELLADRVNRKTAEA